MKVLVVSDILSGFGGTEVVIKKNLMLLSKNFAINSLAFFYGKPEAASYAWLKNIQNVIYTYKIRNKKIQQYLTVFKLALLIREFSPDIILIITPIACKVTSFALKISRKTHIPLIAWPHISLDYKVKNYFLMDGAFAICKHIKNQFLELGFANENIELIHNPISKANFFIERPSSGTVFLYVGRVIFEGQKRLVDLLSSCSKLKGDWCLHIVGDGNDTEKCRHFCKEQNISEHVFWHGWQENPWNYIKNEIKTVSTLILSSNNEGFGLVLAEALAHGVYCLSSDCICGPSDIIKDGDNGLLYTPHNTKELTAKLQHIIDTPIFPSHEHLAHSIESFHDDKYIKRFHHAIIRSINIKCRLTL